MKNFRFSFLIFLVYSGLFFQPNSGIAQELECSTVPPTVDSLASKGYSSPYLSEVTFASIALQIHVLRESDGSGGLSEADVDSLIFQLHTDFNPLKIYFVVKDITELKNSTFYANPDSNASAIFATDANFDAIDLYLAPASTQSSGLAEGIPSIALVLSAIPGEERALSHLMGHCLGLYDTDETTFVDGDLVGDTPEDPGVAGWVNSDCLLDGGFGTEYSPDVENTMCSGRISCWAGFTEEQGARMLLSVDPATNEPQYGNYFDTYEEVTGVTGLQTYLPSGYNAGNMACFDFNQDDFKDLFIIPDPDGGNSTAVFKSMGNYGNDGVARFLPGTGAAFPNDTEPNSNFTGMVYADYDNDGDLDFYAPNTTSSLDTLAQFYKCIGDSTAKYFVDKTTEVGLDLVPQSGNASWGDYDGDGFVDLLIIEMNSASGSGNGVRLFHNVDVGGERKFEEAVSVIPNIGSIDKVVSAMWADFDKDHFVDLVLMQDGQTLPGTHWPDHNGEVYPGGIYSKYFHNLGNGSFSDVTTDSLPGHVDHWYQSEARATVGDVDRDGDLDIFYHTMTEIGWFENDNQGILNIGPGIGWFKVKTGPEAWEITVTDLDGLDLNLDGYIDFFATGLDNCYIYTNRTSTVWGDDEDRFYAGQLGLRAVDCFNGYGSLAADFNHDGFPEIAVGDGSGGGKFFYKALGANDGSPKPKWVGIRLKALNNISNYFGFGATVTVYGNNGYKHAKVVDGGSGWVGQQDLDLVFGLGESTSVDYVHVSWPTGQDQRIYSVDLDTVNVITLAEPEIVDNDAQGSAEYNIGEETVNWVFTWETAYSTNHFRDKIVFSSPVALPGQAPVDSLLATDPNVTITMLKDESSGHFVHTLVWENVPCVAQMRYEFRAKSGFHHTEVQSLLRTLKVPFCISM